MLETLIRALRARRKIRGPLAAAHYRLWRATGLSGIQLFRPEVTRLEEISARTPADRFEARRGRRVLFFTFRGWNTHVMADGLLAHALRLRGADVHLFTCGGRLPVCDITSHVLAPPMPCNLCAPLVTRVAEALKIPYRQLADFVSPDERARLRDQVQGLPQQDFEAFEADGLPVGRLVRASLQWFMLAGSPSKDEETMAMYRRFLASGAEVALASGRLLDALKPDLVVLLNGIFFADRLAIEQARRRSISFVTHEGGFMPGTFVYSRERFAPHHDLGEPWVRYRSRPLDERENEMLDALLRERTQGKRDVGRYYPSIEADARQIAAKLELDPGRPVLTLFTNVDWDTATFAAGAAFGSMEEWIVQTVRYFEAHPELQLVVRIHPAEVRLPFLAPRNPAQAILKRHFRALPANVRVVPPESPVSSYTLMELSSAGLVYTSTVGMEMSLLGRPVIVAGKPYYGGRDFTFEARTPEEFEALLGTVPFSGPLDAERVELARRYAFLFFFRYHRRFPMMSVSGKTISFDMETLDELRPGVHREVDLLCDAILEGGPFVDDGEIRP